MEHQSSFWMQRLEAMPKVTCHHCKKLNVLSSKPSFFQNVPCEYCKAPLIGLGRWMHQMRIFFGIFIFMLPLLYFFYLLITVRIHPVDEFKFMIRRYYDKAYGVQSQQRFLKDWGWLYKEKGAAINDYQKH